MKISSMLLRKAAQKGLLERKFSGDTIKYKVLDTEIVFEIVNGRLKKVKEPPVSKMKQILKELSVYKGW